MLDQFFSSSPSCFYKKGDILLYADQTASSIFYIKSGFVRVYRISENGEELTLTILKPSDFYPFSAGLADLSSSYYLEAIVEVEVQKAPKDQFQQFLKENPAIFYNLTEGILNRFGQLLTRMEYLVVSRAYTKVTNTLLQVAKSFGENRGEEVVVSVPLTHKDIATLAGITRETTCLEMKKLTQKGLIGRIGRFLVVKDIKALEKESLFEMA